MRIKIIRFFNMVEILLALTVIAVGMTSVLGLFPVGLNASREAVAQNCSADVADQMVTYMRVMGESSDDAYNRTFNYKSDSAATDLPTYAQLDIQTSASITTIDLKDGSEPDVKILSDSFLTAYKENKVGFSNTSNINGYIFQRVAKNWAIFSLMPNPTNQRRRVYFIVQGPDCTEDGGNRNVDYSAMALVWKEPVQIKRYDGSAWTMWPADVSDPATAYDYSAKINIELSWPLELPYKDRKKRYYQVVINKPN